MAHFRSIFAQGITQLLIVRFSKFFFCLKGFEKFYNKIVEHTSWHHWQVSYKPAAVTLGVVRTPLALNRVKLIFGPEN